MSSGFGSKAALLALALLAGAALLPMAAADHAYSHRFLVYGRVVDSNGDPVANVTVNLGYKDFSPEGPCANQPDTETQAYGRTQTVPVTNEFGEFMFCFHTHAMSRALPGTGVVRIDSEGYNQTFTFDPYFRTSYVVAKLDHVSEHANRGAFDRSYVIEGRLWASAGKTVYIEGNPVFGYTQNNVPVNITFTHDGITENLTTHTNNYGDFAYRDNVTKRPTSGTITIESQGETHSFSLADTPGATSLHIEVARSASSTGKVLLIASASIVGVAVVGGAGWYGIKRFSARREEQLIRERASRKRANK